MLRNWVDASDLSAESLEPLPQPVPLVEDRPAYVRPRIPDAIFQDDRGKTIPYGERWGDDGPPEDSYSAESHLERFAPLHAVADSLVDYLVREYDVTASDDITHSVDLLGPRDDLVRVINLIPVDPKSAQLTIAYTGYPGVIVHAGVLHDFAYPNCGCDACDETAASVADHLETTILSVVAGGYLERYSIGSDRWVSYAITSVDGSRMESGGGVVDGVPERRLREAERLLEPVQEGWHPWPPRSLSAPVER